MVCPQRASALFMFWFLCFVNRNLECKFHTTKVKWESSSNINIEEVEDHLGFLMLKQKTEMQINKAEN